MRLGFKLRKIHSKIYSVLRHMRNTYHYLKDYFYENSHQRGEIKTLLTIQEGATGDTYNFVGILNGVVEKYPEIKIYCLTRPKTKNFYKNPKLHVISPPKAEKLIKNGEIDSLISYGDLNNFFKKKSILFNIPNRAGRLFPYKHRKVIKELTLMFKRIGINIEKPSFHFTKEGEDSAENFYENKIKNPIAFLQVGSGKTNRALREGRTPSFLWPSENWATVSNYLIKKNYTIVFIGIEEEIPLIEDVIKKMKYKKNILNIAGKFSIEETASIVKNGNLVVGIDSGILHILSQIGTVPIITIGGIPNISLPCNSLNVWAPNECNTCWRYYCPEGNPACINKIKVEEVIDAIDHNSFTT